MITTAHTETSNVTDCKQAVAEYTRFKTTHFSYEEFLSLVMKTAAVTQFEGDMKLEGDD
jgi:hypothetical protein